MKLTIKTEVLKNMMAKAVKGASNDKLIPLTNLMCIQLEKEILTIITTDATNYLYVKEDDVSGEDFYVVIEVDTFSKLIARLTCENVTLTLKDNSLEVKGNGTYNIELPLDVEGSMIKYPNPLADVDLDERESKEVNISTIFTILESIKPALATTDEIPYYTGYYVGDNVIATDTYKIASMGVKIFDEPKLISAKMMNLLSVMTSEKINAFDRDNVLIFTSSDVAIYGKTLDGIDEYQVDAIQSYIDSDFDCRCKLNKSELLQILDRLLLFVGAYDKNAIHLMFTSDSLQISSKSSSGIEIIEYMESDNCKDTSCYIDILMLVSLVRANVSDSINLYYDMNNKAIKMKDGNITHVLALVLVGE